MMVKLWLVRVFFFFFKQKTAYEMRISDWSSDVCSSDLSLKAMATLDWLGMVIIRIQRPSSRNVLTALNDCEPPDTCITARVRPWVGRLPPNSSGDRKSVV